MMTGCNRKPLVRFDHRTQLGKRIKALEAALLKTAGEVDDFRRAQIRTAAEWTALAEEARGDAIKNNQDLDAALRAEHFAQRAVSALGLSGSVPEPEPPSLAGYLARKG
jgi:hypothetical protein